MPETEFVWYERYQHQTGNWTIAESTPENFAAGAILIPAPLVSEQGEWLPQHFHKDANRFTSTEKCENCGCHPHPSHEAMSCFVEFDWVRRLTKNDGYYWQIKYSYQDPETGTTHWSHHENADTEANARQKMLNHLITEGIITKL